MLKKESKDNKKSRIKWAVVCILMTIFIVLLIGVKTGNIQKIDNAIYGWVKSLQNETTTQVLTVITDIGGPIGIAIILVVSAVFCIYRKKEKYGLAITLNIVVSTLTYIILKNIIRRPRPPMEERVTSEIGFSFPSGHTTNNIALYGFFIYLVCLNVQNKKVKTILCAILGIMPILIGFSRIYLRVHYPSDVIAGICLGISSLIIFAECIFKRLNKVKEEVE